MSTSGLENSAGMNKMQRGKKNNFAIFKANSSYLKIPILIFNFVTIYLQIF